MRRADPRPGREPWPAGWMPALSCRVHRQVLRHRRWLIVAAYAVLVPSALMLAYLLHADFALQPGQRRALLVAVPPLLLARMLVYWRLGIFRGYWQHYGFHDLLKMVQAAALGTMAFVALLVIGGRTGAVPPSVIVIEWLLAMILAGGMHVVARAVREGQIMRRVAGRRTLILGAGEAAERLLRQFQHDRRRTVWVVGLLDDNPSLRHRHLHGVPVLGSTTAVGVVAQREKAELLVIAAPSATRAQMRAMVDCCVKTGLEFKVARPLQELVDGRFPQGHLRDVRMEDLLGRAPVRLAVHPLAREVHDQTVLVTGGAGSIGSELARQLGELRPRRLVILEQAESPLYFVDLELARRFPDVEIIPLVGDITDERRVRRTMNEFRPAYVFHAAAYKHVPLMERNVPEAVRNNIFGTLTVARAAVDAGVRKVVLLSTDKAVNPSSVMGASKRISERIILGMPEFRETATDFRAVRFGNVLGSDGSVLPLFRRQLATGGPLTVTHQDVTRYFMTIAEAVQLVLQAAALPEARGRIVMLDMGEPVRIVHLAENLIRLSGLEPYVDVAITFTGLRPGEKLCEELMAAYEHCVPTSEPGIRLMQGGDAADDELPHQLSRIASAFEAGSELEILRSIRAAVPECRPPLRDVPPLLDREIDLLHPTSGPCDVVRTGVVVPEHSAAYPVGSRAPQPATSSELTT